MHLPPHFVSDRQQFGSPPTPHCQYLSAIANLLPKNIVFLIVFFFWGAFYNFFGELFVFFNTNTQNQWLSELACPHIPLCWCLSAFIKPPSPLACFRECRWNASVFLLYFNDCVYIFSHFKCNTLLHCSYVLKMSKYDIYKLNSIVHIGRFDNLPFFHLRPKKIDIKKIGHIFGNERELSVYAGCQKNVLSNNQRTLGYF